MRPRYIAFLLLVFSAAPSMAQQALVRGLVVEEETGQPLAGASVTLTSTGTESFYGLAADGDGVFALRRITPGEYVLRVTFVGYVPWADTLFCAPGIHIKRRIELSQEAGALAEVVVEAEEAGGAGAVTAGLQRIRSADIERVPVPGASGDLAAYIQTIPGVTAVGDRGGQLFIQGGLPSQTLNTIDGLRLYQPFHIVGFYSAFPADIVDEARVWAGGFGAEHGGRVSSVLEVETRNGSKERLGGAFSLAPFLSSVMVEGPLVPGDVSFIVSVREALVERVAPNLFGQSYPYRFGDRLGKIHARLGAGVSASITALHTYDDGDISGTQKTLAGDPIVQDSALVEGRSIRWQNIVVGGSLSFEPQERSVRLDLRGGYTRFYNALGREDDPEREALVEEIEAAADVVVYANKSELRLGLFGRSGTFRYDLSTLLAGVPPAEVDAWEAGGYVDAEIGVGPRLRLNGGIRAHYYGYAESLSLEPRVRAVWRPGGVPLTHEVAVAAGIYRQGTVGLQDERNLGDVFTAYVPVGPDENLPSAIHALASWRGGTADIRLSVEGFYKHFPDLLVPTFPALITATTRLREASGQAYGANLRVEVERPFVNESTLYLYGAYALSRVEYETSAEQYPPPHDRRQVLQGVARIGKGGYAVSARWQYGSGFPFTPSAGIDEWVPLLGSEADVTLDPGQTRLLYAERGSARLPAYHRLDLWFERFIERGRYRSTIRVGVMNVYNRKNLFYFDLLTFRRVDQFPLLPSVGFSLEIR